MNAHPTREVLILAAGVVSPWGHGMDAVRDGLLSARCCITNEEFDQLGAVPVGRCPGVADVAGEDRAITLLRIALNEIQPSVRRLSDHVPPMRRAVSAATSKGAVLLYLQDPDRAAERFLDLLSDAPARFLSREANCTGPSTALVSACATGLHNLFQAADWIAEGTADMALAASTEATLTPLYLSSFANLGALTREGCFPYDQRHCGFVASEGAGVFLLGTREAAARAGLQPIAILRGWGTAAEALHPTAVGADGRQVERLARVALDHACLDFTDIDLVSTHGTGTRQNDTAEANGIARLLGGATEGPVVFSTKGAVGHVMGATGSVELAALLTCMQHGILPASVGCETPAEGCTGLRLLRKPERGSVRRAMKWNLGFGGHLAACVLEKP